jgi:hypothetical protein
MFFKGNLMGPVFQEIVDIVERYMEEALKG